jgi:hypothetical protein
MGFEWHSHARRVTERSGSRERRCSRSRIGFSFLAIHREKVFTLRLWRRFAALLVAVVAIGFALGLYMLSYGLGWFVGALILTATGVLLIARKWLGCNWKLKSVSCVALAADRHHVFIEVRAFPNQFKGLRYPRANPRPNSQASYASPQIFSSYHPPMS